MPFLLPHAAGQHHACVHGQLGGAELAAAAVWRPGSVALWRVETLERRVSETVVVLFVKMQWDT